MFCGNCGKAVPNQAVVCVACGASPSKATGFCQSCGAQTNAGAAVCLKCGSGVGAARDSSKKIVAGVCAILLGALGIHKFILGYTTEGVIMLCASVLSCGLLAWAVGIIALIEGVIYLTKSDEDFYITYVANKRAWF